MFDRIRTARTTVDAERLRSQAAELQALLADAGTRANVAAGHLAENARLQAAIAKEWADPHLKHGVDWARPRAERVWETSRAKAGPHIEDAARRAVPVVDTAHDKLVADLLPKVVAAVNAAAVATAAGADKARDVTSAKLSEIGHIPPPKQSHKGRNLLWFLGIGAVVAAAYQAWRRSAPAHDPWAEDPWEDTASSAAGQDRVKARAAEAREEFQGVVDDVRHELGDAAEAVGEAAGGAVARTRDAAERAREATEKAAERARVATTKTRTRRRGGAAATAGGDDSTETQALPTTDAATDVTADADPTAGEAAAPAPETATPADVAGTIGSQLDGTPLDSDDSASSTTIEDGDENRS